MDVMQGLKLFCAHRIEKEGWGSEDSIPIAVHDFGGNLRVDLTGRKNSYGDWEFEEKWAAGQTLSVPGPLRVRFTIGGKHVWREFPTSG